MIFYNTVNADLLHGTYPIAVVYGDDDVMRRWTPSDSLADIQGYLVSVDLETTVGKIVFNELLPSVKRDIDFDVYYSPIYEGTNTGSLLTDSDATTELTIPLTGTMALKNNHGRAIEIMLPTGSAWHGETVKAFLRGMGVQLETVENQIRDRASIDNLLYGINRETWANALGIIQAGTDADVDAAITRKLSDIGGMRDIDMERELQAAGFPLYVHLNKYQGQSDPAYHGEALHGDSYHNSLNNLISVDPREYRNAIPLDYHGNAESLHGEAQHGFGRITAGAELVVNSLDRTQDAANWNNISNNKQTWHYAMFICGQTLFEMPDIDYNRRQELRRLILEIKPLGMYALLMVNYI